MSMTEKIVVAMRVELDSLHYDKSGVELPWINIPELNFEPFAQMLEQRYPIKVAIRMADDYMDMGTLIHFLDQQKFIFGGAATAMAHALLEKSSKPSKNHTISVSEKWSEFIPLHQPRDNAPPPAWIFFVVAANTALIAGSWVATMRMEFGENLTQRITGKPQGNLKIPKTIKDELEKCLGIKLIDDALIAPIISPFG